MSPLLILIIVVLVIAAVLVSRSSGGGRRQPRGVAALRREYARLLQMPPKAARDTTDRILREMQREYPNRSTAWHLKKMISDLERDRR